MRLVAFGNHITVDTPVKKLGVVILTIANGFCTMKTVIKLAMVTLLLISCDAVLPGDHCNSADSVPYLKSEVSESHCSGKCCEFVMPKETETCREMWCYYNCDWEMMHGNCY